MNQDENQSREHVEAVPGPAIIVSKDTYKKCKRTTMQNKIKKY